MIKRPKPERFRLRRTMMFMNAQKPGLIKDAYIYGCDSIMLDLEDAVAENQKDAARFSLYHALTTIDYGNTEVIVRINGLDTPYWREDIRACVAGGCDSIRIPKTEHAEDVHRVAAAIAEDEKTYGRPEGEVLIIAALESARGVMNALEICESDERLFGIALSGGDYTKDLQTHITGTGIELMGARQQMIIAARAAGVQCFDTVFTEKTDRVMLEQDRDIRSVQDTFLHDFGCTQIRFADNQIHLFCQAGQIKCFVTSRITTTYNSHHFLTIEKTVASRTSRNTHSGIFLLIRQS